MATASLRLPENVPGRFYVDSSCVGCDACGIESPRFFKSISAKRQLPEASSGLSVHEVAASYAGDYTPKAIVYRQPATPSEIEEVRSTMGICPSESIGELTD